ncbi:hypothetical protein D918_07350 [Trichuris suis]|nr:hypothetical protein D918_07350 [Trichuris suis]
MMRRCVIVRGRKSNALASLASSGLAFLFRMSSAEQISRRCASVACMPGSPDDVVIDMNDLTAISKTPNFPALATFGSGSSKLCFPDFSWTSATTKRPTVDDNCPCDEPTDICMSRCNSSKLAFSMFEKSSICTVQRKAKYHETVLQNILDEEETETEPLTENCCTKKRTGRKIIDQGDAEEEEVGPRFRSKVRVYIRCWRLAAFP